MAGYDVMCGIGSILKTPSFAARGFRPSGVFGPLGAAATAAAIHGLDHQRAVSALAIATGTSAGLREWAHAGTTDVYVQNGFAARNGYTAAQLAAHGITGPKSALDGAAGLGQALVTEAVDWDAAARQFAQTHAVRDVEFKRFPACSAVQGVLELATRIWTRHRIDPAEISTVTVYTHRHGATNPGCDNAGPFSSIGQAQMSNQLGVSLALHGEKLDVNSFARHDDPSVSALARLVDVREDPELTARYPGTVSAKIVIRGTGRDVTETLDMASSLGNAEIMTFVQDVLDAHFSSRAASEIMDDLQSAEELEDLHHLLALLRGE
jgi:2-methylcitrate dehydratase PrpD